MVGIIIGVIVAKANVASFIVTLGVTTIARGGVIYVIAGYNGFIKLKNK